MTTESLTSEPKIDPYAEKAMSWYGWGSPIGFSILILSLATSAYLLHLAGVIG
ncbi:MAG TPA: hypothetical protein VE224_12250 [Pseudolabrys sp.]|nr:hypothetical protein [Pseudolabrys sp.]